MKIFNRIEYPSAYIMKFKASYFLFVFTALLFLNCSTGPDFERDSIHDSNATSVNGKFIYPKSGSERSKNQYNSFSLVFNKPAISSNTSFYLKSDIDGVFFESNSIEKDSIDINLTRLTSGNHNVSLFVKQKKVDTITLKVNLPDNVILSADYADFKVNLDWTKYLGDDFKSYKIFTLENSEKVYLKEISDINDTTFSHHDFNISNNLEYGIETSSSNSTKINESNIESINTVLFNSFYSNYADKVNRVFFINNNFQLCSYIIYSQKTDCYTFQSLEGKDYHYFYNIYINDKIEKPVLIAFTGNKIEKYDLISGEKINEINFETRTNHLSTIYEPIINKYFLSAGYGSSFKAPYLLNWNSQTYRAISYKPSSFDDMVIKPEQKLMFANDLGSLRLINYDNSGNFTGLINLSENDSYASYASVNSVRRFENSDFHVISNANRKPIIISTNPLNEIFELDLSQGYYTSFFTTDLFENYLFSGTNNGTVIVYSLKTGDKIYTYKFKHRVEGLIQINNKIITILKKDTRSDFDDYSLSELPSFK